MCSAVAGVVRRPGGASGGVTAGYVIDVASNRVILDGVCMPHSTRLDGDLLILLEGGAGRLGFVGLSSPKFTPVAFCPGLARELALADC